MAILEDNSHMIINNDKTTLFSEKSHDDESCAKQHYNIREGAVLLPTFQALACG